ncbi:MAG: hypothetical protein ACFB14_18020 [Leptolyngbyaceae cyanobacterium]
MEALIKPPLQNLFQTISQIQTIEELRQVYMADVGQYFAAKRWGVYFLDQLPSVHESMSLRSMLKRYFDG